MMWKKDVDIKSSAPKTLLTALHTAFIKAYEDKKNDYEYVMSEPLRMNGVYWCLTAMDLMHHLDDMGKEEIVEFVLAQRTDSGGFRPAPGHDPHILSTLSAVQIMVLLGCEGRLDAAAISGFLRGLQGADGSFTGDEWGEVDTRFSFCALAGLALLGRLASVDVDGAVDFVLRCRNADGGFGTRPGSESHAGQIYCCLGVLSITRRLHRLGPDGSRLASWLAQRQLGSGGLNGRPEKQPDVCYSWWVLSSLAVLGKLRWISADALRRFVLAAQDDESGGFSDRPGNMPDPFHTVFGLAGLSLLGDGSLKEINPVFCMPQESLDRLHLDIQIIPANLML